MAFFISSPLHACPVSCLALPRALKDQDYREGLLQLRREDHHRIIGFHGFHGFHGIHGIRGIHGFHGFHGFHDSMDGRARQQKVLGCRSEASICSQKWWSVAPKQAFGSFLDLPSSKKWWSVPPKHAFGNYPGNTTKMVAGAALGPSLDWKLAKSDGVLLQNKRL